MQREGVCLIGYGQTKLSRPEVDKRSDISYVAEAMSLAIKNAGIEKKDIRGLSVTSDFGESPWVAEELGLELDWVLNPDFGGASAVIGIRRASDAIQLGEVDVVVCANGKPFSGRGGLGERGRVYQRSNFMDPYGYGGPNSLFALIQRRHMAEYGTTAEQLGKLAVHIRRNAMLNEQALFRTPLTLEDYLNARPISDPFRLYDCVPPCGGGAAIVVASERKAKELMPHPIYLVSDNQMINYRVSDMMNDRMVTGLKPIADELFTSVRREELDFVEIYDDYPFAILLQLEDLGFCERGKGGAFIEKHDFTITGDFPLNTHGGQLSGGQPGTVGGYLHMVEAVRQLKGEAGAHQVKGAKRGLVTGIGWLGYNVNLCCWSALILERR